MTHLSMTGDYGCEQRVAFFVTTAAECTQDQGVSTSVTLENLPGSHSFSHSTLCQPASGIADGTQLCSFTTFFSSELSGQKSAEPEGSVSIEGEENHELASSPFLSLQQWAGNHTLASLSVGSTEVRNVQSHKIQDSTYQIIPSLRSTTFLPFPFSRTAIYTNQEEGTTYSHPTASSREAYINQSN
ncbi:hypothetical protein Anapl_00822 [Anas platyrhynchos]|uniref:Uncharacterized protein n=1 Tax=Anas platyrhynchos TaxID=8839 RepID=R0K931_ANAPL|nr:hypothetical protein Anapl_00822 [Anas platyrhynchos]